MPLLQSSAAGLLRSPLALRVLSMLPGAVMPPQPPSIPQPDPLAGYDYLGVGPSLAAQFGARYSGQNMDPAMMGLQPSDERRAAGLLSDAMPQAATVARAAGPLLAPRVGSMLSAPQAPGGLLRPAPQRVGGMLDAPEAPMSGSPTTGPATFGNNVGNIRASAAQWQGEGQPYNGFETFASPEAGVRAAVKNLQSYARRGVSTLGDVIATWAPAADSNNPTAYAAAVSQETGIGINDPLPLNDPQAMAGLVKAMTRIEKGRVDFPDEVFLRGAQAAIQGAGGGGGEPAAQGDGGSDQLAPPPMPGGQGADTLAPPPEAAASPQPGGLLRQGPQSDYAGLLRDYEKRQQHRALQMGLLRAGAALMAQGPSRAPVGLLSSLGQGLGAFQEGYANTPGALGSDFTDELRLAQMQRQDDEQARERQAVSGLGINPDLPGALQGAEYEQMHPKPGEGYSLSPGEARYDASGKLIAERPAAPKDAGPFTLGPGDIRFDASGKPIAQGGAKPTETFTAPYRDEQGNWVQRSQSSGKVDILVKASERTGQPITLQRQDGTRVTLRGTDPQVDQEIGAGAMPMDAVKVGFDQANKLRDDFARDTKDIQQAFYGYEKVKAAASDPSAAGDVALIFGYMKLLDPTSVVREGEFATAQNTGSVPQQITALYNRVLSGERLTEQQRSDFIGTAERQFGVYRQRYDAVRGQYTDLAKRSKVDPRDVFAPLPSAIPPQAVEDLKAGKGTAEQFDEIFGPGAAAKALGR